MKGVGRGGELEGKNPQSGYEYWSRPTIGLYTVEV